MLLLVFFISLLIVAQHVSGSVGNLLRCSLRASHGSNSVVNLYVSVIPATKGIIFKICFMFQTDTFDFIHTCMLAEQVVKQDHMLVWIRKSN